mmetsp:Transcript_13242/g.18981  ORF Transcript_13242/g.18981 Transcript_13242/m.18981 type:complete len:117 (+) Transcript_13242:1393-1743(+)
MVKMDRATQVAKLARDQRVLMLRLFLLPPSISATGANLSLLPSAQTEKKQITNAPMRERVAAVETRNVISLNVMGLKPMNKVDENEMLNLLHESSTGLKTIVLGMTTICLRTMLQR